MRSDGEHQTRLTNNGAGNYGPTWSLDSARIAFASYLDGDEWLQIYTMNADGSGLTKLTDDPATPNWSPTWGPGAVSLPPPPVAGETSTFTVTKADDTFDGA